MVSESPIISQNFQTFVAERYQKHIVAIQDSTNRKHTRPRTRHHGDVGSVTWPSLFFGQKMGSKNRLRLSQKAENGSATLVIMSGKCPSFEKSFRLIEIIGIYTKHTPYIMCNQGINGL